MNNAKMWLVVSPNVGVPLFLGAVAVGSFAVHLAVLSKTHWFDDFVNGKPLGSTASAMLAVPATEPANAAYLAPGSQDVLIVMPDGSTAHAILQAPPQGGRPELGALPPAGGGAAQKCGAFCPPTWGPHL